MSQRITLWPPGYGSILGLRSSGATLENASSELQAVIDTLQLYLANNRETLVQTVTAAAAGNVAFGNLTVPAGEFWYVHAFGTAAANGTASFYPVVGFTGGAAVGWAPREASVGGTRARDRTALTGFWATPGTTFSADVPTWSVAADISGTLVITRLRI